MELQIRGVSKTYANGVRALKDVTLTIPAGMYGLLGPNGAGKSTLMRMVATLQEPDTGTITLGGIDVVRQKDEVRKTLGYLPQEFGVYPKVSAESLRSIVGCNINRRNKNGLFRRHSLPDEEKPLPCPSRER
jgi:ABC-type multidrug transport system ATPase subunit